MTLHEAMMEIMRYNGKQMTGKDLSDQIAKRKTYLQKSGDIAPRSQIELRAKNYPQYFIYDKSCTPRPIGLVEE